MKQVTATTLSEPHRTSGSEDTDSVGRRGYAIGLMIASSVVISFTGLIVRHVDADPMVMNFYRALSLMVAVTLILAIQYRRMAITHVIRIGWPGIAGGVMLTVAAICFLQSMTHTTVANTLFILGAIPFFTAALAWVFLRERPTRATLWAMMIAFSGITVMLGEGFGSGSAYGNLNAMVTAVCFSIYTVLVRRNRHVNMLPALLVSTVLIVLVAGVSSYGSLTISTGDLVLCVLWGGVLSGFTSVCFIVASRHLAAAELTLFMLLEFALGPIWVWLFVNEIPSRWTLLGGSLVVVAVITRALVELRQPSSTGSG